MERYMLYIVGYTVRLLDVFSLRRLHRVGDDMTKHESHETGDCSIPGAGVRHLTWSRGSGEGQEANISRNVLHPS